MSKLFDWHTIDNTRSVLIDDDNFTFWLSGDLRLLQQRLRDAKMYQC